MEFVSALIFIKQVIAVSMIYGHGCRCLYLNSLNYSRGNVLPLFLIGCLSLSQ